MRIFLQTCIVLMILLQVFGCDAPYNPPPSYLELGKASGLYEREEEAVLTESLFKEDQAVISNEAISQILSSKIMIPEKCKLVISRFTGSSLWSYWSEELLQSDQQSMNQFINRLKTSKRLAEASYLPSIVISKNMTVSQMRSAAARTQSDLLLVYRTKTKIFEKYRLLGKSEARAYSSVEAILLDVRTGIIPFSTIATETHTATQTGQDWLFTETIMKAQQQATDKALVKIADDVVKFLNNLN